jgi:hypothetical protein
MRGRDIHLAVEELLGGPVAKSSVKSILASDTLPGLRRVDRGSYQVRSTT